MEQDSIVEMGKMDTIKGKMLELLEKSRGIVVTACKTAGIARSTHYNWINDDPAYRQAVEDINQGAIDYVESKLLERIQGVKCSKYDSEGAVIVYDTPPSDTAIIFYLKTKGKKRGYVEKQEIDHGVSESINPLDRPIIINVAGIPKSERENYHNSQNWVNPQDRSEVSPTNE